MIGLDGRGVQHAWKHRLEFEVAGESIARSFIRVGRFGRCRDHFKKSAVPRPARPVRKQRNHIFDIEWRPVGDVFGWHPGRGELANKRGAVNRKGAARNPRHGAARNPEVGD